MENSVRLNRSSCPEVFCKEGAFRNFTKFARKHLCHSLFSNKVADLRPATLLKKSFWHRCFPVNFVKFLRTTFCMDHLWWLLLNESNHNVSPFSGEVIIRSFDLKLELSSEERSSAVLEIKSH